MSASAGAAKIRASEKGSKSKPIGMKGSRKLYIKSFGCQMNVYDLQRMADTLAPEGYVETATPEDADLVILNTCHIREKAAEKVYSELGRMRALKEAAAGAGRDVTDRGGRLRRAGRRRGDHPPRAGRRSRRRTAELSPPARPARARRAHRQGRRHRVPGRGQVRRAGAAEPGGNARARRHRLRHRAGRLRQVLHLLRRSLYARRRGFAPGRARSSPRSSAWPMPACARSRCIGQNVNAYHGEGADGRSWPLGAAAAPRSPRSRASRGCATPPAIRATWTTI